MGNDRVLRVDALREPSDTRCPQGLTVLVALLLVFAFVTSPYFLASESHHDCSGDGCVTCAEMMEAACASHGGCLLSDTAELMIPLLVMALLVLGFARDRHGLTTLVFLKVQLND